MKSGDPGRSEILKFPNTIVLKLWTRCRLTFSLHTGIQLHTSTCYTGDWGSRGPGANIMLKMGFQPGRGLGKVAFLCSLHSPPLSPLYQAGEGRTEPVLAVVRKDYRAGVGASGGYRFPLQVLTRFLLPVFLPSLLVQGYSSGPIKHPY